MKNCLIPLFLAGTCLAGAASADDAALLRCRTMADAATRLACYDAISTAAPAPSPARAAPAAGGAPAAQRAAYVMPVPGRAEMEQMFGKEPAALQAYRLASYDTHIEGKFEGWVAGQRIRLANGQVWAVVDGSDDLLDADDPKVTVKRGLLGAFFLDIEGAHRAPKVRREQ